MRGATLFRNASLLTAGFLVLTLRAALPAAAQSGGLWQTRAPLEIGRQESGAALLDGLVYVVGGLVVEPAGGATDTVEVYDPALDDWSFVTPLPQVRHHPAAAAADGRLFVLGGYGNDFSAKDSTFAYDPATGDWSELAPLPGPRGAAWAVEYQGEVYLFGGVGPTGQSEASTFIYDPVGDSWRQGADMPTPREHLTAAVVGDLIYVIGGRVPPATTANERYSPATDSWQVLAPMPTARTAMATAAIGDRIVVVGGEAGPFLFAETEIYDTATDSWSRQTDVPLARHGAPGVALGGEILVPGGGILSGELGPTDELATFLPGPTLTVGGVCPGTVELRLSAATPSADLVVAVGPAPGALTVPGGPCAGTPLGLDSVVGLLPATADAEGALTVEVDLPAAACATAGVQVVDLSSCLASNVAEVE